MRSIANKIEEIRCITRKIHRLIVETHGEIKVETHCSSHVMMVTVEMDFAFSFSLDFGISELDFDIRLGFRMHCDINFNVNFNI